jgi:chondroitin AC lyase
MSATHTDHLGLPQAPCEIRIIHGTPDHGRRRLLGWAGVAIGLHVLPQPVIASQPPQSDIERLAQRLRKHFVAMAPLTTEPSVEEILSRQDASGRWPDLEQHYGPNLNAAKRYSHCLRITKLAGAWVGEQRVERRLALGQAIQRALGVWLGQPAPPGIPWFNLIGTPTALGQAALILGDALSPLQREQIVTILKTCVLPDGTLNYAGAPATGQNLMHEAMLQVTAGILENNAAYIETHVRMVEREIGPGRSESIQLDYSFHQHGAQLYSGGLYGVGFSRDAASLAWACRGTRFALGASAVDTLTRYVLDGQQPMTRGEHYDYTTAGRMVAWPELSGPDPESAFGVELACDHLAEMGVPRRVELTRFAARLRGKLTATSAASGHRVFWQSDYAAYNRPGFMASARMSSTRIAGHESGSKQNELGYHLGDGAMCLMQTGQEYHNIFPLWNWRRVPGVSCVDNPALPFPLHTWGKGAEGGNAFVGGVSDGSEGVAAMVLDRAGLSGHKAWFFLDDMVVCLGSALVGADPILPVVTSVNQCWLKGPVRSSAAGADVITLQGPGWVHHDGVAYLFPAGGRITASSEQRKESWDRINSAPHRMVRSDPLKPWADISGGVFTLWMEHGAGATQMPDYCYVVVPGVTAAQAASLQTKAAAMVLANKPDVQAVAARGTVQVVLWRAGEFDLPGKRRVSVNRPCILQWRRTQKGRWRLAVGNPDQSLTELIVRIEDPAMSPRAVERRFQFTDAATAGRSQVASV